MKTKTKNIGELLKKLDEDIRSCRLQKTEDEYYLYEMTDKVREYIDKRYTNLDTEFILNHIILDNLIRSYPALKGKMKEDIKLQLNKIAEKWQENQNWN